MHDATGPTTNSPDAVQVPPPVPIPGLEEGGVMFPLIAEPDSYRGDTIDMMNDAASQTFWLDVFEHHTPGMIRRAIESDAKPDAPQRAEAMGEQFLAIVRHLRKDPAAFGRLSILRLCDLRYRCQIAHGFEDPYLPLKQRENEAAMRLLPDVLRELDKLHGADLIRVLVTNIFAGNIFDMGCASTIGLYEQGQTDFHAVRKRLSDQAWRVDDFDTLIERWSRHTYRKAVMFVDNSGADVLLGMIPLARHLLRQGMDLVMTANTKPALNDVTHAELVELIDRIARVDAIFADALDAGQLTLVPSGNHLPVIDLSKVSGELAAAAAGADLLIIEGMGRALETNYYTRFTCDTLKVAMVKEQNVADLIGGQLYDVVCRFELA